MATLTLKAKDARRDARDWYAIHPELWAKVNHLPGLQVLSTGVPIVHRTHLPEARVLVGNLAILDATPVITAADRLLFDAETAPQGWKLREYQHTAREYIRTRRGTLLADAMRLGKTGSSVAAHELADGTLLVIAPLATRKVWENWFQRRWPNVEPAILKGRTFKPDDLKKSPLIFCHYDIAMHWQSMGIANLGTVIIDEAHALANHKSRRTQTIGLITTYAPRVLLLTGTPLWNQPAGLWPMLHMLNPGAWGTRNQFLLRYCAAQPGPYGLVPQGTSNEREFVSRLSEVMLRRVWRDVATELPAVERNVDVIDIDTKLRRQIDAAVEGLREETDHKTYIGKLANYRRLVGAQKVERAVELARQVLTEGESVVIWVWHRQLAQRAAELLTTAGHPCWTLTGDDDQDTRDASQAAWQACKAGALIVTLAVGQAGVDFSAARHAIFAELDFTPAVIAQAEMRTFAITRPMAITYLVVDHEADQKIVEVLQQKFANAERLQVPAADSAIEVLGSAFGEPEVGDLDRLLAAVVAGDDGKEDLF